MVSVLHFVNHILLFVEYGVIVTYAGAEVSHGYFQKLSLNNFWSSTAVKSSGAGAALVTDVTHGAELPDSYQHTWWWLLMVGWIAW